jgi:hypothetical protein
MKRGDSPPVIPDLFVSKVISDIQKAFTLSGEPGPIAQWVRSHRSGEPVRRPGAGESLVRACVEELLEFPEFKDALSKYGKNSLEVYVSIRTQRATLLKAARDLTARILEGDSDFGREDIGVIVAALESYEDAELERGIQTGQTLLAGGEPPSTHTSGCELAMRAAYRGPKKITCLKSAIWAYSSDTSDQATQSVIRVISRHAKHNDLAGFLRTSLLHPALSCVINAWDLLPPGHDALLFDSLVVRGSILGIAPDEIAKGRKKWGSLSEAEISRLGARLTETKGDSVTLFLTALGKIRIATPDFFQWRTSLVNHLLDYEAVHKIFGPKHLKILISLLYEDILTEELQESKLSAGLHTNLCSLKISPQEEAGLSDQSRRILETLNRWMNAAFSDYALERGLFTSTSLFLEGSGQTRRTLKDLCRVVKRDLRANPSSVPTQKLYKAITTIQRARRTGENLEQLRRRLARNELLYYREAEVSILAATETYLRRHGIQGKERPLTQFPALMLLRKIDSAIIPTPRGAENGKPAPRVVRRSKGELNALVSLLREKIDAELTFKSRLSFPRLLRMGPERRHITEILGKLLLGVAVAYGGRMAVRSLSSPVVGEIQSGPADDLIPNGSLPRLEKMIANLSRPFSSQRNDFLLSSLVGATPVAARQPRLMYKGSGEVREWIHSFDVAEYDDCVAAEVYSLTQGGGPALPLSANLRMVDPQLQADGSATPFTYQISTSKEKVIDSSLSGKDLARELGDLHLELSQPRLRFSELRTIDLGLAEAIERARAMNAVDAVEYLRNTVAGLIRYEESPEYDNFRGTFDEYLRTILKNRRGVCGQFAIIFDEALKQAGIPSCIAAGYLPNDDRVTYTTAGAHATNVVFLRSTDGKVVPRIVDATGMGTSPAVHSDSNSLFDLVVPGAVTIGGLGIAAILLHRQQRRRAEQLENEALEKVAQAVDTEEEPLANGDQSLALGGKSNARSIDPDVIVTKWVLHHLHKSRDSISIDARATGLEGIEAFDIDAAVQAADAMKRELMVSTEMTRRVLLKTGLSEHESTVGIVNGWLRSMEDPGRRRQWVAHLQDRKLFTPRDADALLRWAQNVVPAFKGESSRFSFRPRLNLFSQAGFPTSECLLRALTPIDT